MSTEHVNETRFPGLADSLGDAHPYPSSRSSDSSSLYHRPLCVDLDGTLVKSDTLLDSMCALARNHPGMLWKILLWLRHGKAALKREITAHTSLDPGYLPYNEALMLYLREQAAQGRQIYLTTGADHALADRVAAHLGIFHGVLASNGSANLTGPRKLRLLQARFGERGFDYIGNSRADLPLLENSGAAMLANPVPGLRTALQRHKVSVDHIFSDRNSSLKTLRRTLRVHQWAKNILVFLPLILAHAVVIPKIWASLLAFFSFCMMASSTYIFNDLLDLSSDRRHATKRRRPFAAGDLSVLVGAMLAAALFTGSLLLSLYLGGAFRVWLLIYAASTLAYSLYLKRVVIVDVLLLSALYTLRILAGAAAAQVVISAWMAGFAIFFFFSLALIKRFSELENLRARGESPTNGRGYLVHDMEQLRAFGTASAFASIVVFTLYINNPEVRQLYHHPQRLWLLTPLLLWWLSRIWLRASRGQMHEDPVVFALTDKASLLAGFVIFLIALAASM